MYIADKQITPHGIRLVDLDKTSVHIPAYDALKLLVWLRKKEAILLNMLHVASHEIELEEKKESATLETTTDPTPDIP